jgi:replication factor C subunit 2/4
MTSSDNDTNDIDDLVLFSSEGEDDDEDQETERSNKMFNGDIPWVEKYRPKKLDDIIEHDEIIKILKETIKTGEFPNLLLHGPAGTGKTSTILAIAKELFGPVKMYDRVIELNASDDRGIGAVRTKIKTFAKTALSTADPNYPSPNFQIVILDEADSMTPEAQAALRKVMEEMSKITRFCFICNYIGQIIDPIVSRCMRLKFKPIKTESITKRVSEIAKLEGLNISDDIINSLIEISDGDARRVIMNLQNFQYLIKYNPNISPKDILSMNGNVDKDKFPNFWRTCSKGSTYSIKQLTLQLHRQGFAIKSILKFLMESIVDDTKIKDSVKSKILLELCKTDRKLSEGCDEYLQLLNILLFTNRTIVTSKN